MLKWVALFVFISVIFASCWLLFYDISWVAGESGSPSFSDQLAPAAATAAPVNCSQCNCSLGAEGKSTSNKLVVAGHSRVAICAVLKDEAPYLLEWIAYHWLLGVRHFFLFDHWSTDDPSVVLDELVEAGLVDVVSVPRGLAKSFPSHLDHPHQGWAYSRCARDLAPSLGYDWLLNIDLDEFLVVSPVDEMGRWPNRAVVAPKARVRVAEGRQPLRDRLQRLLASPLFSAQLLGGVDISSFSFGLGRKSGSRDRSAARPVVASFVHRESVNQYNDVKCLLRVGREIALGVHACETDPPAVMANGEFAQVDESLNSVRRGPAALAPLAVFHYRIRSVESCAFKAVREPPQEYKHFLALSNCLALSDPEGPYSTAKDYRLAVHTDLIMRTARCLHPAVWHRRFSAVFPELAREPITETCYDSMFGIPFDDGRRWEERDWRSGNWLLYERQQAEVQFDGSRRDVEFPSPTLSLPNFTKLLLEEPFRRVSTYAFTPDEDKEFWISVANETSLVAIYETLVRRIKNE